MKILGISDHFTSGAAVVIDGRVVAAVNEERLASKKMVMGFPRKSIAEVGTLVRLGVSLSLIECIIWWMGGVGRSVRF